MKTAILVDIDDCTLEYSSRLREYVNDKHNKHIVGLSQEWDVQKWLDLGDEEGLSLINEFADSWAFGTLDPMPGAVKVLNELARSGIKILAVSSCGNNDIRSKLRFANLYNVFGPIFEEITLVGLGESKEAHIQRIYENYNVLAFVDDRLSNLLHAKKLGIPCVLFKQPHNRADRNIVDYDAFCWYSVKQFLEGAVSNNV